MLIGGILTMKDWREKYVSSQFFDKKKSSFRTGSCRIEIVF